jgi:hypothetical protein
MTDTSNTKQCANCGRDLWPLGEIPGEFLPCVCRNGAVSHPAHYGGDAPYEAIKVIEAWELGFHLGNTVKYICRAGKKDFHERRLVEIAKRIRELAETLPAVRKPARDLEVRTR